MQITNNTSTPNFSGAFRFKASEIKAKTDVPQLFTQGRQVFHDILEKGDEVVVVRNKYDKRIGNYIRENNLSGIEYYPEINTKSGLDDEKPDGLLALMKDKAVVVKKDLQEIFETISNQKLEVKQRLPKVSKEVNKISKSLRLNLENPSIESNKSFTLIRDEAKKRTIEVIAPNNSTSYVRVTPDSLNEQSIRCILNGKGNVVKTFETPNEILKFNLLFNKLRKENANVLVNK